MPFTPFHMGAAVLLKPVLQERFSVLVFGVSQVAIDLEPLVRMLRGDAVLHGWTHTLLGAAAIGAGSATIARPIVNWWLALVRRQDRARALLAPVSWRCAFTSACIGAGTHLIFDGIMHSDMRPFAPLRLDNPLLGAVPVGTLHLALVIGGAVGLFALALGTERDGAGSV